MSASPEIAMRVGAVEPLEHAIDLAAERHNLGNLKRRLLWYFAM